MYPFTGLDYWTGILDWNTGLTFGSKFNHVLGWIAQQKHHSESHSALEARREEADLGTGMIVLFYNGYRIGMAPGGAPTLFF